MKKILILNGAGKKNGNTAALIKAFTEGAESAGNEVKEFCEEINAVFKYTSAKNNVCIDELFKELGYKFLHSEFMKDMSISLSSLSDSKDTFLINEKNKEKEINLEKIGCC